MTDRLVTRHQLPMEEDHPIIDPSTYDDFATLEPFIKVVFVTLLPAPTLQPGPTTTFGPTTAVGSTSAEASIKTFPTMLSPVAKSSGESSFNELK